MMHDQSQWEQLLADTARAGPARPQQICQLCVDQLPMTGAGIAVVTVEGNRGVVCATDEGSARVEELQFALGEGPCIDAASASSPVLIPDLDHSDGVGTRWPVFRDSARVAGVRAVFAFPLRIGAIIVGVLDLYCDQPGELDETQLSKALTAADAAALALLEIDVSGSSAFSDDGDSRASYHLEVHQATGMVQVQLDVGPEVALVMLRARAFSLGRPVVDVAREVVARRLRFTQEDR